MKKEEKNIKVEIWNEKTIGGETASLETFLIKQSDGNAIRVLTATLWPVSIELKICRSNYIDVTLAIGKLFWTLGIGIKRY